MYCVIHYWFYGKKKTSEFSSMPKRFGVHFTFDSNIAGIVLR